MRRKSLILVAFLLMLFIAPMIFISSSVGVAIPTEPNMNKDFSLSGYGDESPQSIPYFNETLPDDVLHFPDAIISEAFLADDGYGDPTPTGDYTDTHVKDASSMYTLDASSPYEVSITLEFTLPIDIESFNLSFYGYTHTLDSSATTKEFLAWNGTNWVDLGDIAENNFGWKNVTLDNDYINAIGTVYMKAHVVDDSMPTLLIDYAEIRFYYMTLADADHFAESFTDVSEWSGATWATSTPEGTFTTDGDVGSIEDNDSGVGSDNDGWTTNDISFPDCNYYLEIRYKVNITTSVNPPRIYFFSLDDEGGTTVYIQLSKVTSWTTYRCYLPNVMIGDNMAIESIILLLLTRGGDSPIKWDIDYLRISPSNESGWQHDCSSVSGTYSNETGDIQLADSGTTDYEDTFILDNDWWGSYDGAEVELDFVLEQSDVTITGVEYAFFGNPTSNDGNVSYDDSGWVLIGDVVSGWNNDTLYFSGLVANTISFKFKSAPAAFCMIDYFEVRFTYIPLIYSLGEDLLNVTKSIIFPIDTTATASLIETSYYPFLDVFVDEGSGYISVEASADGSSWSTIVSNTAISADTHYRGNVLATGIDVKEIRVTVTNWTTLDFCKLYSIANFTVSQSGVSTNDYLYVSSGTLYSHIDSGYITLDHDPTIDLGTHYEWDMDTSLGTPEVDFYDGSWLGYSSETEGEFSIGSTVTDFRLKFTDNANIISLKFTDRTGWYDAGTVIIFFEVPVFTGSLDAMLIFFGLILIPASTLYFVKGGKDEMSNDKLFYCLIAFAIGWGLFLGGIYG